jgi:hypothetical protein
MGYSAIGNVPVRQELAGSALAGRRIAEREHVGSAGHGEIRADNDAAGLVLPSGYGGQRRSPEDVKRDG